MKVYSPFAGWMAVVILTCGAPWANAQEDSSPMGNIGAGSQFVVGASPIVLPANEAYVYFQDGAVPPSGEVDPSRPSCRLLISKSGIMRQLLPDRKLIVSGAWKRNSAENSGDWDILRFETDKAVDQLQCNKGKDAKDTTTIGEVKAALGQLFKLVLAPPLKAGRRDGRLPQVAE